MQRLNSSPASCSASEIPTPRSGSRDSCRALKQRKHGDIVCMSHSTHLLHTLQSNAMPLQKPQTLNAGTQFEPLWSGPLLEILDSQSAGVSTWRTAATSIPILQPCMPLSSTSRLQPTAVRAQAHGKISPYQHRRTKPDAKTSTWSTKGERFTKHGPDVMGSSSLRKPICGNPTLSLSTPLSTVKRLKLLTVNLRFLCISTRAAMLSNLFPFTLSTTHDCCGCRAARLCQYADQASSFLSNILRFKLSAIGKLLNPEAPCPELEAL